VISIPNYLRSQPGRTQSGKHCLSGKASCKKRVRSNRKLLSVNPQKQTVIELKGRGLPYRGEGRSLVTGQVIEVSGDAAVRKISLKYIKICKQLLVSKADEKRK
jgi:hypothetical protein